MSQEDLVRWKPLSFTHIEYVEGDILGFILAVSSLFPIFILVSFVTHIYFRREIHTICFLGGIFVNEFINLFLKLHYRELRPKGVHMTHGVEYGWPSAHSQFMSFFMSYIILFCYIRVKHELTWLDKLWKHFVALVMFLITVMVSYSRFYLKYHTLSQVFSGLLIGCLLGMIWFTLTQVIFTTYFPILVELKVCKFFMIRDSTLIPNILKFEYTASLQESNSRLQMTTKKVS
uniref:Dolichyldiphosphatase n=1 Tax=Phallusia mammillata TaxID=59560 RepID=A0A6F9DBY0_9ASCI|nr:dolichyldiphosphatase 1-like [Phallusia mammillata]